MNRRHTDYDASLCRAAEFCFDVLPKQVRLAATAFEIAITTPQGAERGYAPPHYSERRNQSPSLIFGVKEPECSVRSLPLQAQNGGFWRSQFGPETACPKRFELLTPRFVVCLNPLSNLIVVGNGRE